MTAAECPVCDCTEPCAATPPARTRPTSRSKQPRWPAPRPGLRLPALPSEMGLPPEGLTLMARGSPGLFEAWTLDEHGE